MIEAQIKPQEVSLKIESQAINSGFENPVLRIDSPPYEGEYEITPTFERQVIPVEGLRMTQNLVIDPIPLNINVATGTIESENTSAIVEYSGVFVNAYTMQNGQIVLCDISIGNDSVMFSVAEAQDSAIDCFVVFAGGTE